MAYIGVNKDGSEFDADSLQGLCQAAILIEQPKISYIKAAATGEIVWRRSE